MVYATPTIAWRGKLAQLQAQVYQQKPEHGERAGTLRCICGSPLHFNVQSTGISRAHCAAGCGVRWSH